MKRGWSSIPGTVTEEDVHSVGCCPSGKRCQFAGNFDAIFDIPLPLLLFSCGRILQPANVKTVARQAWTARNLEADVVTECGEFAILGPPAATNLDQRH